MPDLFPWAPAWLRDPRVLLALTAPVQFWVGAEFHRGFLSDLRHRSASMATLVSLGTNAAFFFSVAVTLWPHVFHAAGAMTYYETSARGDHPRRAGAVAGGAGPRRARRRPSAGS